MPKNNKPTLASAVRERRGSLSLRQAGKQIGIVHTAVVGVEKGRMPMPGIFLKLMRWLNVIDDATAERIRPYTH